MGRYLRINFGQMRRQWIRRNWPEFKSSTNTISPPKISVVCANYNTVDLISQLIFSLCRIVGREKISEIVIVDNNSTDGSVELLSTMQEAKIITAIFNSEQRYHGPALNQAMDYLLRKQIDATSEKEATDYVIVLDSDVVVLRSDILEDSVDALKKQNAGLCGQFQPHKHIPEGYAHINSILIDPVRVWKRGICTFEEVGDPAVPLQKSMIQAGIKRVDFPFCAENYLLHLGRGTLKNIFDKNISTNNYFEWAREKNEFHFQGNPNGFLFYEEYLKIFSQEVSSFSPELIVEACLNPQKINFDFLEVSRQA